MTLPFAGLARARARMIGGRLEGEAQKWTQGQEEAQRLFREWATRKQIKQMEQAEEAQRYTRERNTALDAERKADRAATLARQNQTDQLDAIQAGGEDAPEMTTAQLLAGLSMMQGGTGSSAAAIKAPRTSAYKAKVGGVDIQAEDMGGPSYATVGGRMFRFDRQKGANAAARQRAEKEQFNIADDNRRLQQTLQAIGARSAGEAQQPPTPVRVTEGERKAAALLNLANDAFSSLDRYQPSVRAQQASKIPVVGNILAGKLDEEGQAAQQAGFQFADAYMRFISGAAVPESEVRRYMGTFMPQPGDSPATVARKKSARNAIMQSLRIGAGRAVNPNAPETELPTDNMSGRQYSPHNPFAR